MHRATRFTIGIPKTDCYTLVMFRISSEVDDLSSESGSGKIISVYLYSIQYSEYTPCFTQRTGDSRQRNVYLFSILSSSLTFCDKMFGEISVVSMSR